MDKFILFLRTNTTAVVLCSLAIITVLVIATLASSGDKTLKSTKADNGAKFSLATPKPAPEIAGIDTWINSQPLKISELKGKVVLVDFWTYSCINCIRNNPHIEKLYEKYKDDGLVVIGMHAPEFAFERNPDNVRNAVKKFGLTYPVALDNDMTTWKAFENNSWPAGYFIDRSGNIRHVHLGEGEYDNTELVIQSLLAEGKTDNAKKPLESEAKALPIAQGQTPETYLNYSRGSNFLNSDEFKQDDIVDYKGVYKALPASAWSLGGKWKIGAEDTVSQADGAKLSINFSARELYLVMGSSKPTSGKVTVDGNVSLQGSDVGTDGTVQIGEYKLYRLVKSPDFINNKTFELTVPAGIQVNAFTFGG